MKLPQAVRPALICLVYLGLHFGTQLATLAIATHPQFGVRPEPGIAMALLIICGPSYWPAVFVANLATNHYFSAVVPPADWMQLVNPLVKTAGYALVAWLIRRRLGPAPLPKNRREAGLLIAATFAAPLPWAVLTTLEQHESGRSLVGGIGIDMAFRLFVAATAMLSIVPAACLFIAPRLIPGHPSGKPRGGRGSRAEYWAQAAAVILTFWLVQAWPPLRSYHGFPLYFVVLVWIALSRGMPGATLVTVTIYLGNYLFLCVANPPAHAIGDFVLFSLAFAGAGLGLGTAVMLRDRAEAALAESQDRLARVHAGSRLGLWDCDLAGGTVAYDQGWADILDYCLQDIPSDLGWWGPRVHPEDRRRVEELLAGHFAGRTPIYEAEFRFQTGKGDWKWILARGSVTARDEAGKPMRFAGTQVDLTDRKLAEAERIRLLKEMEEQRLAHERRLLEAQKLESLGVLAGGIAHDFNNLLTVMLGNVSLAEFDLPPDSPVAEELQQVRASALRAAELCKQLLAYSGKGQFTSALVDLSALVEDTTQLLHISINKRCSVKFELARGLPPVQVDPVQIRQIVMNLVINASDAIGDEPGRIRLTTGIAPVGPPSPGTHTPGDLAPGDYVYLEVADNGCGMSPEVKARIFEPFFSTKFAGRGLGLAAVLGIVRGHRGALTVTSEPGSGSTFRLLLPAAAGVAAPVPSLAPLPSSEPPAHPGTILVVDDEDSIRLVSSCILETCGFSTVLASNGREALAIFQAKPERFTAILLDLTMPEMNGEETLRELRRLQHDVPVILMSGFSEEEAGLRFARGKSVAFIPKPFDREALAAKLQSVLGAPV